MKDPTNHENREANVTRDYRAAVVFSMQSWLGESEATRQTTSTPGYFSVGMSGESNFSPFLFTSSASSDLYCIPFIYIYIYIYTNITATQMLTTDNHKSHGSPRHVPPHIHASGPRTSAAPRPGLLIKQASKDIQTGGRALGCPERPLSSHPMSLSSSLSFIIIIIIIAMDGRVRRAKQSKKRRQEEELK